MIMGAWCMQRFSASKQMGEVVNRNPMLLLTDYQSYKLHPPGVAVRASYPPFI